MNFTDIFQKRSRLKNESKEEYRIALAGNPNVGKSTIFNNLTGMHQHTGNWTGKTVANATGECIYKEQKYTFIDLPGTYSIMSNSEEEEIARDYICFGNPDTTVVVVDATTLERNLNLVFQIMEITDNVILCVNLLDEAKKKKIKVDLKKLSNELGIPVVGTIARNKRTLDKLLETIKKACENKISIQPKRVIYQKNIEDTIAKLTKVLKEKYSLNENMYRWISLKIIDGEEKIIKSIEKNLEIEILENKEIQSIIENIKKDNDFNINYKDIIISKIVETAEKISNKVCIFEDKDYSERDRKIDKILTSKKYGIPIMMLFLGLIFWLTIVGANYPSQFLFDIFSKFQEKLINFATYINCPSWLSDMLILGVYQTLTWVVSVMLPPMAIFFPLFTILEDLGYLPRIAFNMDGFFKKACCSGKQMITMCMGFGCNACGVTGCRIINSPRERLIAIITNNLVPCNGRFPFLITIATIFIAGTIEGIGASIISTISVMLVIVLGIFLTLIISKVLSKTILKGMPSSFILEMPPYRKPQFCKIFVRSIFDRTLFILGRAVAVAMPAGLVIWLFANIGINGSSILDLIVNFLDPFARLMGLDGYILTGFILGIPANEIVLPIILMCYLQGKALINIEDTFAIGEILRQNGWTILTAINVMIFTILHFPCATTLLTIKKETGKMRWVVLSFLIPTVFGIIICMLTNLIFNFGKMIFI
ncbi:MAG: ferrous iron transport protein B [Clostridia bacterium]|nr:ferrous iron transport protein B [Clostridium sp.]